MSPTFCWRGRRDIFVAFLVCFFSLATSLSSLQTTRNIPYRAAIYEHAVISPPNKVVNRADALINMMKNVKIYEEQTKKAASKGVKIIVFPEYGILGINLNRTTVKPYLEEVPDPRCVSWNPSEKPNAFSGTDIQRELSRIAKENKIYMVVNMGTKVPCTATEDPKCPSDGQYQFNTNVVYSDNGTLVAVYHKRNLYIDKPFDPAPAPEYVTFDTPFGRFGTVICFDLMFKEPTYNLLDKYKVRNLAYPTASVKIYPFHRSLMVHSGFARGNSINVLAANLHELAHAAHGSGLYAPDGARAYFYNTNPGVSKLVIADMQAIDEDTPLPRSNHPQNIDPDLKTDGEIWNGTVQGLGAQLIFTPLLNHTDVIKLCKGDFCCGLDYEIDGPMTETYALGVGNGYGTVYRRKLFGQICTLSKCNGENCTAEITGAKTMFKRFTLTGYNFNTKVVMPHVVAMKGPSYVLIDDEWTYNHTSRIYMEKSMSLPLHSAVLGGRVFDKDQPPADSGLEPILPKCKKDTSGSSNGHHLDFLAVIIPLLGVLVQWMS